MPKLELPDFHFFEAATGWLELGNPAEAEAEFARISKRFHDNPDVLELRWAIDAAKKNWEASLEAAQKLLHVASERVTGWLHLAYSWRRVKGGGLQAAWEALLPAATKFPEESTVAFNLSCYAAQMGKLDDARVWLRRAMRTGGTPEIKAMALADPDLQPLWDEIQKM